MKTIGRNHIVVGVDGSTASDAALAWATEEAAKRRLPLDLARIDGLFPTAAAVALVDRSPYADTIVLGSHQEGTPPTAPLGEAALQVAMHAECPVVVVREPADDPVTPHGVVVGVDGSSVSDRALGYAFEQASARGTGLDVVHAWGSGTPARADGPHLDQMAEERLAVSEAVVGWSERFSDVPVRQDLPMGPAVDALVASSRYAELLVVGSRGLGGLHGLLLGSVSQGVLQQATCPVAVVRQVRTAGTQREIVASTSAGSTGFAM
jgi:nucleotide-binding universal stress UspA family protein